MSALHYGLAAFSALMTLNDIAEGRSAVPGAIIVCILVFIAKVTEKR